MSLLINHFYRFGEFTVDADQKVLLRDGTPVPLTPKVFDTLLVLVESSPRIVAKEELMVRLWPDSFVEETNLTFNIKQLRRALGDDARHPIYIETVARRGYRFIAEVEEVLSDRASAESGMHRAFETADAARDDHKAADGSNVEEDRQVESASGSPPVLSEAAHASRVTRAARSPRRWAVALAVAGVILVAGGGWLWTRLSLRAQRPAARLTLAVLPFENLTGDAGQEYFSDGLTEEMITQLGNLDPQRLGVIARTSVMQYKNSQTPLDQIGRELGVEYVLEGSVRRDSENVRITVQLIKVRDQTSVWTREYDRQLQGLLELQREIGQEVADQIQLALGNPQPAEPAHRPRSAPPSYEAYDLWLRGQYLWNKREGFKQAIEYFQQAVDRDPTFARAYVGLADCYALIGGYSGRPQAEFIEKARAAALRALELDEGLAEAHAALALIAENYDWDWQTAEKEFLRAIELNPNSATAHHWYAEHLAWRGRFDEALRESEQALKLDPLSLIIATDRGVILYYARQYDRAIQQFRAVRELDPTFPRANYIVSAYEEKGRFAEALADLQRQEPAPNSPWHWSDLAYAYGRSGEHKKAEQALERLLDLNRREAVDASALIAAYIGLGDKQEALAWLDKAYAQHSNSLTGLKVEPRYDPLRADPRFQSLLRKIGLDH